MSSMRLAGLGLLLLVLGACTDMAPTEEMPTSTTAVEDGLPTETTTTSTVIETKETQPPPTTAKAATAPAPTSPPATTGVYYSNCSEARAAGAAPIKQGEPGYRSGLDRDGDGIACDK